MSFDNLIVLYASLAGIGALIALIINILKYAKVVQDDTAQTWSAALNLVALVAIVVVSVAYPSTDLIAIDAQIGKGVEAAMLIFGYVVQLISSAQTHNVLRNVPVIGTSYSQ